MKSNSVSEIVEKPNMGDRSGAFFMSSLALFMECSIIKCINLATIL